MPTAVMRRSLRRGWETRPSAGKIEKRSGNGQLLADEWDWMKAYVLSATAVHSLSTVMT
jgi:hypothetical protein